MKRRFGILHVYLLRRRYATCVSQALSQNRRMSKGSKRAPRSYKSIGTTYDGVRILKPKTKPAMFTEAQIRSIVRDVLRDRGKSALTQNAGNIFVEQRENGDFAVRRQNSQRASAVLPTQKKAIEKAKELAPDKSPLVKRVRNTEGGDRGRRRKI